MLRMVAVPIAGMMMLACTAKQVSDYAVALGKIPNVEALEPNFSFKDEGGKSWLCVDVRVQNHAGIDQTGKAFDVDIGLDLYLRGDTKPYALRVTKVTVPATEVISPREILTLRCASAHVLQLNTRYAVEVRVDAAHALGEPEQLWADNFAKGEYTTY